MKFSLTEYNVTPNLEERNEFKIGFNGTSLFFNGEEVQDDNKVQEVLNLINSYKEQIINLDTTDIQNYKGGRQKSISIIFDDNEQTYRVYGSTPDGNSSNLYETIKNSLLEIIK